MLPLFEVALRALTIRAPLVVAFGEHPSRWCAHLADAYGCDVVDLGFSRHPSALLTADLTGRVDLVCALDVLHRVREPRSWLRAAGQLLRPGGRLLTTVPNAAGLPSWWDALTGDTTGRSFGRAALIRDHQHAGFVTLGHGYMGFGLSGLRRPARRSHPWTRAWRRRLAPSVYYLGARVDLRRSGC
jgi:SAM-dependent methyltransferase